MARKRIRRRLALGILLLSLCAAGALALLIRHDLRADAGGDSDALHARADRWFFLTQPLFWRWAQSDNEARFYFAAETFIRMGAPYARLWLDFELRRNPSHRFPFSPEGHIWRSAIGVNDRDVQRTLIAACVENLDGRECQFNASFLSALMASTPSAVPVLDREVGTPPPSRARLLLSILGSWYDQPEPLRELLGRWENCAARQRSTPDVAPMDLASLCAKPTADILKRFHQQDRDTQRDILHSADDPKYCTPNFVAFLRTVADGPQEPCRAAAAFILWDQLGDRRLARFLDQDLASLDALDDLCVLKIANHFPASRYVRACRAYAAIRGGPYFREDPDYDWSRHRPWPPAEEARRWRAWLREYPDHPSADDAGYWLGRCLEWQGKRLDALRQFADLLLTPRGDNDMASVIWIRFLLMLDVGTTEDDLRAFLAEQAQPWMRNVVTYTLALRRARAHDYAEALRLSAAVNPTRLTNGHEDNWNYGEGDISTEFYNQRHLWQRLKTPRSSLARYDLAMAWDADNGWKIGYFILWQHDRAWMLLGLPDDDPTIADGFRHANPCAVSLALLQQVVHDPSTPPSLLQRALEHEDDILGRCFNYPEEAIMSPLPDFPRDVGRDATLYQTPLDHDDSRSAAEQRRENEPLDWYDRQRIMIERRLRAMHTEPPSEWASLGQDVREVCAALHN